MFRVFFLLYLALGSQIIYESGSIMQDIGIVVYISKDLTTTEAESILTFIKNVLNHFSIGPSNVLVSLIFAGDIDASRTLLCAFDSYTDKTSLTTFVDSLKPVNTSIYQQANVFIALSHLNNVWDQSLNGTRSGADKAVLVIAGVPSSSPAQTTFAASLLKFKFGVVVHAVGFGDYYLDPINKDLENVVTNASYVHTVDSYEKLCNIVSAVAVSMDSAASNPLWTGCTQITSNRAEVTNVKSNDSTTGAIVGGVFGGVTGVLLVTFLVLFIFKHKQVLKVRKVGCV